MDNTKATNGEAQKAARKYAKQFRNGRPFDTLPNDAMRDFLAGVAWARGKHD